MNRPLVSICVPTYHANGEQERILKRLIKSVREQVYPNIELVISDQDALPEKGQAIHEFTDGKVRVKYLAFEDKSGISAHNTNNAILNASGDLMHILNHDDFYYHENALRDMVAQLEATKRSWLAAACLHTDANETKLERVHSPSWPGEHALVEGVNRIGCPSVVLYRRELNLRCSEQITYAMDCDLWIQAFRAGGEPAILPSVALVIRMWDQQFTAQMNSARQLELDKIALRAKYGYK
jgi:glycosyltransferase involved in cell wall biosynthesis